MLRRLMLAAAIAGAALLAGGGGGAIARACWYPPVAGVVVDPFRAPSCTWCAGNRGIEYRVGPNIGVRAAVSGVVSFAGTVAGTRYVVVQSRDGSRITYGRLRSARLAAGDRVLAGTTIATAAGEFFLGLRIGDEYVDPAPYIGRLVGRPRLVPVDGSVARPSPTVEPRCGIGVGSPRVPDSIAWVGSPGSAAVRSVVITVPLVNMRSPREMRRPAESTATRRTSWPSSPLSLIHI